MDEDLIQVATLNTIDFADESEDERELDLDEVDITPEEQAKADIPNLPPMVPPGGSGIPSKHAVESAVREEPLIVEVPSGELPGATEGLSGFVTGALLMAAGWLVVRWL